jgi:hypothetical protein
MFYFLAWLDLFFGGSQEDADSEACKLHWAASACLQFSLATYLFIELVECFDTART